MWRVAGLAVVVGCAAAWPAAAQSSGRPLSPAERLAAAAFAARPPPADQQMSELLDRRASARGGGDLTSGRVRLSKSSSLRLSRVAPLRTPAGRPLDLRWDRSEPEAYEVAVLRNWPGVVAFETGRFDLELSPHAGLGLTSYGGLAEAGATLRLGQRLDDEAARRLRALGVRDGALLGDQGRWYLFAAASGRAVGWNVLRSGAGWDRAGWTTDPASTLVGDAQLGVGWRRGPLQTSFGVMHREVKGEHMIFGQETREDTLVAFSVSVKPGR